MARIGNLGDLETAISEWLMRTGDTALAARTDTFIQLFESEFVLDPEMRTAEMEEIDIATVTDAAIDLPDGFLEMIRLKVTGSPVACANTALDYVSPNRAAVIDAQQSNISVARNYTVIASEIFFVPQSAAPVGATLEMAYYKFAPLATAARGVNWLLTKYPNIYLYGSLMQAAAYIDDKDTVAQWAAGLTAALAKLAKSDAKRKLGAGPLRMGMSSSSYR